MTNQRASFDMPGPGASWEERGGWMVKAYARDLGLHLYQAAGLVGNFGGETEGLKYMQELQPMVPGSRGGWGLGQWTGPRRRNFEAYAQSIGREPGDMETNYRFAIEELQGDYRRVYDKLRNTGSIEEATKLIHAEYETPADVLNGTFSSFPKRLSYAQRALAGAQLAAPGAAACEDDDKPTKKDKPPFKVEQAMKAFNREAKRLQTQLKAAGFYTGEIDGDWGPGSRSALLTYLRRYAGLR